MLQTMITLGSIKAIIILKESSSYYWYQAANTINSDFSQYGKDVYAFQPEVEHNFVKAQLTSNYYWGLLKDSYDDPTNI